jgi:hypothetical protein
MRRPSRIANRSSMAIGHGDRRDQPTVISTLLPGITISIPPGGACVGRAEGLGLVAVEEEGCAAPVATVLLTWKAVDLGLEVGVGGRSQASDALVSSVPVYPGSARGELQEVSTYCP